MQKNINHTLKRMAAGFLALILLLALSSCKALEPEPEPETEPVMFSTFEKNLRKLLDESELYKIASYETKDYSGEATHVLDIVNEPTSELLYSEYKVTLFLFCNTNNELTGVSCMAEAGYNVDIALISHYIYMSLGLSEMDADTFYDTFEFFKDEPAETRRIEESGWQVYVSYREDYTHFSAFTLSR